VDVRWGGRVVCPTCGSADVSFLSTRRVWKCREDHPRRQFSVKVGTIFEDSPIPLDKWLAAMWLIANAKNGISSYEIGRALGVTQKTGWFMLHRIRLAMESGSVERLRGRVEADETFIGGKVRNMHRTKRLRVMGSKRGGTYSKAIVMGMLERGGIVRARVIENIEGTTLRSVVRQNVEPGAEVITDAARGYLGLSADFIHNFIDHMTEYVRGHVHTNGMENFWSLLKRAIKGTYVSVEPYHLHRYVDEQAFRYNARRGKDADRFLLALRGIIGRRLTYRGLTVATT
jgi:transposase-like protein